MKAADTAVVHKGESVVDKGVAVQLDDGRARCGGANMGEDTWTADDTGEVQ